MREKMKAALERARGICELAEREERDFTPEERQQVQGLLTEAKDLKEKLRAAEGDASLRQAVLELGEGIALATSQGDGRREKQTPSSPGKGRTLGEQFIRSEAWQGWMKRIAPNGKIPDSLRGFTSPPVEFRTLGVLGKKELITGLADDSAGAFVVADDTGIYEPIGRYPTVLRDLISIRQTTSDTVEFVRQTKQISEAAPTQEANVKEYTGYPGEIEGRKPQGQINWERVTETVKTIAVWVGATKRALSDVAQLRGIIDQELREDLADEFESQLFTGDGTGENFTGLAIQPGTLLQAFDTDILTTARRAIERLLVVGRSSPTAWVFHPTDWATVELLQDNDGRFYHGGPLAQGPARLWSVPVVQSFHVAQGSAWLANWRKMVVWDREQASVSMTDSHEDWFVRNMIAILAEMRAAMGLIRPAAFCEVELA